MHAEVLILLLSLINLEKKLEQSALGRQDLGRAFQKKKRETNGNAMTKA
jgi:hypothetical protein